MKANTSIESLLERFRSCLRTFHSRKASARIRSGWARNSLSIVLWGVPLCIAAGGQEPPSLVTLAESNFESNSDGWLGVNSGFGIETLTRLQGGPSTGSLWYISVGETTGDGTAMFFSAPTKYLGDKRNAYHGVLSFNFKQSATDNLSGSGSFVQLSSPTLSVVYSLPRVPTTTWRRYEIPLDEAKGWYHQAEDRPATQKEFLSVLANLQRLWIRAEYSYNSIDRADLDDVLMLGNPAVKGDPTVTVESVPSLLIQGESGRQYQIQYTDTLKAPITWHTLTNIIIPSNEFPLVDYSKPRSINRYYTIKAIAE